MVRLAHQMAFLDKNVVADRVDAAEFPTLVERYRMQSDPRTVGTEVPSLVGARPPEAKVIEMLRAAHTDGCNRVDAELREACDEGRASAAGSPNTKSSSAPCRLGSPRRFMRRPRAGAPPGSAARSTTPRPRELSRLGADRQLREIAQPMRSHIEAYTIAERCHASVTPCVVNLRRPCGRDRGRQPLSQQGRNLCCGQTAWPARRRLRVTLHWPRHRLLRDLLSLARGVPLIQMLGEFRAHPVLLHVGRDQSTELAGLLAAGDVTDEPDNQIIIAAAFDARAALVTDRYLSRLPAKPSATAR